jgi:hypothetical protein
MDYMRYLLWAYRGLDPYPLCSGSPGCLQLYFFHTGGYYFRSVDQEWNGAIAMGFARSAPGLDWKMQVDDHARKMNGRIFGEMVRNVCVRLYAD